jgi:hypothetical protein
MLEKKEKSQVKKGAYVDKKKKLVPFLPLFQIVFFLYIFVLVDL